MSSIESTYRVRQEQRKDSLKRYERRQWIQVATSGSAKPRLLPRVYCLVGRRVVMYRALLPGNAPALWPKIVRR